MEGETIFNQTVLKLKGQYSAALKFEMKLLILASVLALINGAVSFRIGQKADCAISINNNLGEPQPLIVRLDAPAGEEWAYPASGDIISVAEGEVIQLACPGSNVLVGSTNLGVDLVDATCVGGLTFTVGSGDASFSSVTCGSYPFHTGRYTGETCDGGNQEAEIGFEVGTKFLRTITICFDAVAQNTVWSKFTLTTAIGGYHSGFPRPSFIQGDFYNVGGSVDSIYSTNTQRGTINSLLGLAASSTKYIAGGDYFLSRGHMTAKADFVFGTQHRSTFWFINVAPQWQTFNGRNWNTLEMNTRTFGDTYLNDLTVYTGTYGIATLPHESTGEETPLFLYVNGEERGIPVPEIYWKVIYDPVSQEAIAFVGANNPYKPTITPYCTDICNQISWINWNANDVVAGLGYCCDVRELRQTISTIPDLEITGVLT